MYIIRGKTVIICNLKKFPTLTYLVPKDVHDEREDCYQLEEDQSPTDHRQRVVQVEVVQEILKKYRDFQILCF